MKTKASETAAHPFRLGCPVVAQHVPAEVSPVLREAIRHSVAGNPGHGRQCPFNLYQRRLLFLDPTPGFQTGGVFMSRTERGGLGSRGSRLGSHRPASRDRRGASGALRIWPGCSFLYRRLVSQWLLVILRSRHSKSARMKAALTFHSRLHGNSKLLVSALVVEIGLPLVGLLPRSAA